MKPDSDQLISSTYWYVVYATADSHCRIVVRGPLRRSAEPEDDLQEAGRLVAEMSGQ